MPHRILYCQLLANPILVGTIGSSLRSYWNNTHNNGYRKVEYISLLRLLGASFPDTNGYSLFNYTGNLRNNK